ncbi:sigma-70 family RNA polymerase sigma factor [Sphingobacterium bambusae]|uniref:Sigma-70 family RNA polymerase sigma factor n=1 Tax=Sphingobacterium bambusae TaxID=662858 RepID=A0ABW6BEU2_9SPHI|nr:sigma-70 family RNA polymerase sigma factor [Sphingobacterium bambusae]WPL48823.1 sigma-70 family RNA polymerase sigma factor [Sphingobacterium bambusae]
MRRIISPNERSIDLQNLSLLQASESEANLFLNQLFEKYWKALYQFSFNLLQDGDEAQDTVQELFINLWDRRHHIDIQTSLEAYLFSSVRYKSLTKLQAKLSNAKRDIPLESLVVESFQEAVDPSLLKELQEEIALQISKLPARMQQVIRMRTMDCMSISEIAKNLHISEDTVKNHLAAARKKLRIQLGDAAYLLLLGSVGYLQ